MLRWLRWRSLPDGEGRDAASASVSASAASSDQRSIRERDFSASNVSSDAARSLLTLFSLRGS